MYILLSARHEAQRHHSDTIALTHLVKSIRDDTALVACPHSIGISLADDVASHATHELYEAFPQTRERMRLLDVQHSWYHQEGQNIPSHNNINSNNSINTRTLYDIHLAAYLAGCAGDDLYYRTLHIEPVRYVGSVHTTCSRIR